MLNRATKSVIYVLLQVTLLATPTSVFTEVQAAREARILDPISVEKSYELPHSASASMNIEGKAQDSDVEACMTLALEVLDALPEEHADALEDITFVFDDDAKRGQAGGNKMRIRCANVSEEEFAAVLIHEMGHVVDLGLMEGVDGDTNAFQDGKRPVLSDDPSVLFYEISWVSNYDFSEGIHGYSFVSQYAASDPFEDFAESYAAYVLHGEMFREFASSNEELAEKYEFLKTYVFDGVEYDGISLAEFSSSTRVYDVTKLPFDLDSFLNK